MGRYESSGGRKIVPEGEAMPENSAYGCLFCLTGKERYVARWIRQAYPGIRAFAVQREKLRVLKGQEITERDILMPGYVFFEAPETWNPFACLAMDAVIRVLALDRDTWQLQDQDRAFAAWLFQRDGLLQTSKAYRENDRIRVVSGPLKDLEGSIRRINRHNRRGQVELNFDGRTFSVWLNFKLVEPAEHEWKTDDKL